MKNSITLLLVVLISLAQAQTKKLPLLIGTYTKSCDSKGIYVYDFDTNTGDFVFKNATEKVINPSYLSLSKDQKRVYSVNENGVESTISSFQFDATSGELTNLNQQKAQGADPCYIINDDTNVIVANYSGGNIAVFGKKRMVVYLSLNKWYNTKEKEFILAKKTHTYTWCIFRQIKNTC